MIKEGDPVTIPRADYLELTNELKELRNANEFLRSEVTRLKGYIAMYEQLHAGTFEATGWQPDSQGVGQ